MNAMDKIKKQFKDFWSYYKLTKYGVNTSGTDLLKSNMPLFISSVIVCILAIFQFSFDNGGMFFSVSSFVLFVPFAVGAASGMGILFSKQPSLISISPFTPKQRMVFCYCSAILRAIELFVLAILAAFVALFFVGCLLSLISGEWIFVVDDGESIASNPSLYENMFLLLLGTAHFFAFFAIGHMHNVKRRNIASIIYASATLALSLILSNVCGRAMGYSSSFFFGVNLTKGLAALHLPWLVLVIEAVLAALAIGASVFFVRKRYASTEI